MQSVSSLNKNIDISLFFSVLNDTIYTDIRFNELLTLIKENPYKYTYACYTESCFLKSNIYIPIFHTLYLASKHHHVVLSDNNDFWVIDVFPNNTYYILTTDTDQSILNNKVKLINSLKQIGEI